MANDNIGRDGVRISVPPPPDSTLKTVDDVYVLVTQAFCPYGHNLIMEENETFADNPGIKLNVEYEGKKGSVTLSPFHGDTRKKGDIEWADGSKLNLSCPTCNEPIPKMANCRCKPGGDLLKLFITPSLKDSHVLAVCNVWGCHRSRTIDNYQIISEYLNGEIDDD